MTTITILGANGFVGQAMCRAALGDGMTVRAVGRDLSGLPANTQHFIAGDQAGYRAAIEGSDFVVNCIGRAHVLEKESADDALSRFRQTNRDLAAHLAELAISCGAKGFAQMSSVAAIRSRSAAGETIDDATPPAPSGPYGLSKLEGDLALAQLDSTNTAIVSLRPPVLVGSGAPGQVAQFARAARIGVPLPIANIDNRRSFMSAANLADATLHALRAGARGAFIVTDSDPMTSREFYDLLVSGAGHSRRTFPFPPGIVRGAAKLALGERAESLLGSAAYGSANFRNRFGWQPLVDIRDAAYRMTADTQGAG